MVDFSGWQMPIQYTGIRQEHLAVRSGAGIFDVSHMGRVKVEGKDAESFLDYLSTNKIAGKADLTATYTVWCYEDGTCVDDVIIYRLSAEKFYVILNASNREKDLDHLKKHTESFEVTITPLFSEGIIAIQGPKVLTYLEPLLGSLADIKPMRFKMLNEKEESFIAATGYTGEKGFEIAGPSPFITFLWDQLVETGVVPIGLGARDTLRLEKGYALYGHELSDKILATESISNWTVKIDKTKFLGKEALQSKTEKKRFTKAVELIDKGIAREGNAVFYKEKEIGQISSGTFSPSLDKAIALALVNEDLKIDEVIEIQVRANKLKAKVVALPFFFH
jgi:aminomethyltransferase